MSSPGRYAAVFFRRSHRHKRRRCRSRNCVQCERSTSLWLILLICVPGSQFPFNMPWFDPENSPFRWDSCFTFLKSLRFCRLSTRNEFFHVSLCRHGLSLLLSPNNWEWAATTVFALSFIPSSSTLAAMTIPVRRTTTCRSTTHPMLTTKTSNLFRGYNSMAMHRAT